MRIDIKQTHRGEPRVDVWIDGVLTDPAPRITVTHRPNGMVGVWVDGQRCPEASVYYLGAVRVRPPLNPMTDEVWQEMERSNGVMP